MKIVLNSILRNVYCYMVKSRFHANVHVSITGDRDEGDCILEMDELKKILDRVPIRIALPSSRCKYRRIYLDEKEVEGVAN